MHKDFVSATANSNGTYSIKYNIVVSNTSAGPAVYSLKDTPGFDNDVTIINGSYTGPVNGNLNPSGSTTLATNVSVSGNQNQTYALVYTVTLNLDDAPGLTGDNVYTPCTIPGNNPGNNPGQGLYNLAELFRNTSSTPEISDDACGDLPYVKMKKNFVGVTSHPNGTYTVNYQLIVTNVGGTNGTYSLVDAPLFDDDINILSGTYSGQANGSMNISGSTTLANNVGIAPGVTHTYDVSFVVKIDLSASSGGNNIYTPCAEAGNGPGSAPGQGLYNLAKLDRNGDSTFEVEDDACGDLPYIKMRKDLVGVTPLSNGTYYVSYKVIVENVGGASGNYTMTDTPSFDDDVTINAWDYTFVDVLGGFGNGPAFVGAPIVPD